MTLARWMRISEIPLLVSAIGFLIAYAFGVHIPNGYIYAAMGFSAAVETINIVSRNRRAKKRAAAQIQE